VPRYFWESGLQGVYPRIYAGIYGERKIHIRHRVLGNMLVSERNENELTKRTMRRIVIFEVSG